MKCLTLLSLFLLTSAFPVKNDKFDIAEKCEDILTVKFCDHLKLLLNKLVVKVEEIDLIVRENVKQGISEAKDLYQDIYNYLKKKIICKISLWCPNNSTVFVKRSTDAVTLKEALREHKTLLEKAIPTAQQRLREMLDKMIAKAKNVNRDLKESLEEIIFNMNMMSAGVDEFSKNIYHQNLKDSVRSKRDIYDQLKMALKFAHEKLKDAIQELLTMTRDQLKNIHSVVDAILKNVLYGKITKRETGALQSMEKIVQRLIDDKFFSLENEAELQADVQIKDLLIANEHELDDKITKRDISNIQDKMKEFYKKHGDSTTEKLSRIDMLKLESLLASAGEYMLGNVKDLYKSINTLVEQQA